MAHEQSRLLFESVQSLIRGSAPTTSADENGGRQLRYKMVVVKAVVSLVCGRASYAQVGCLSWLESTVFHQVCTGNTKWWQRKRMVKRVL